MKKNRVQREQNRILAKENIRLIEEGNLNWLAHFSEFMTRKGPKLFGLPNFLILEEEFGPAVRNAAEKGYAVAWQSASVQVYEEQWESNKVPWYEIVISHALEAQLERGRIDWASSLPIQVQVAAYLAVKHYDSLPEWFARLYVDRRDLIDEFFEKILAIESNSKLEHLPLCRKIFYSKVLYQEFQEYARKYLLSHPLPENQSALDLLLGSSHRSRDTRLADMVAKHAVNIWNSIQEPSKEELLRAMSLLVAWWYFDWSSAWQFIIASVFIGSDRIRNILSFAGAMMRMLRTPGEPGFIKSCPTDMPVDAAIAFLPYLYEAIPPSADATGGGIIGEEEQLSWFRQGVLNYVQSGELQKAKKAFGGWGGRPVIRPAQGLFPFCSGRD